MIVDLGPLRKKVRVRPTKTISGKIDRLYNAAGVLQSTIARPTFTIQSGQEDITYTVQKRTNRSRSNWCSHSENLFNYYGDGNAFDVLLIRPPAANAGWYYETYNQHVQCCEAKSSAISAAQTATGVTPGTAYLGTNGQALINSAWDDLRPDLTKVSIPNFIAEIDDIQALYKVWKKNVSTMKNLAGLHLNYKFGWKPTIGDLKAVIGAIRKLQESIAEFEANVGKKVQVSKTLVNETFVKTGTFKQYSGSPNDKVYWTGIGTREVKAFVTYAPQPLAVFNGADKILRGIIDSLGFELNPRIIWDALPFTFVIDWFFDVGSYLQRLKIDALELPIELVDSCLQCKQTLSVDWYWDRGPDATINSTVRSGGARNAWNHFHRMPIFPDYATLAGFGFKMPNFNQATLLVSLATVLKK